MTAAVRILTISIIAWLGAPSGSSAAPEAWYIEMPVKHASFLVEASAGDDIEAYKKVLGRIPDLIRARTIREIEHFERGDANRDDSKISGRVVPDRDVMFGGERHQSSSDYEGNEEFGKMRLFLPKTKFGLPQFRLFTHRKVGREWMPTWTYTTEEGKVNVLLERDLESGSEREFPQGKLELTAMTSDNVPVALTWFIPTTAVSEPLSFEDVQFAKIYGIDQFRNYGFMFTLKEQAGQETGFSFFAKFVNRKKPGVAEIFGTYQPDFDATAPFEAPFGKTTTTYSRDTGQASDEDGGEDGQFVLKFSKTVE